MKGAPSFARWLRQQRDRDDPVGDLAQDFAADPRARRIRTVQQLAAHLSHSGACSEARFALREAAQEFRAHQLPQPPARPRPIELPHLRLVKSDAT